MQYIETVKSIIANCRILSAINCPCTDSNGDAHWSGTLHEMQNFGDVEQIDITCLSLSRYFGPTPSLDTKWEEGVRVGMFTSLWPEGNPTGSYLPWDDLADSLQEYADSLIYDMEVHAMK